MAYGSNERIGGGPQGRRVARRVAVGLRGIVHVSGAVAHIAQKRRVPLTGLSINANAWCAAERESFRLTEVRLTVKAELPAAELRPLVAVAERYRLVSNTLRNGRTVVTAVEEVAPMEANR